MDWVLGQLQLHVEVLIAPLTQKEEFLEHMLQFGPVQGATQLHPLQVAFLDPLPLQFQVQFSH